MAYLNTLSSIFHMCGKWSSPLWCMRLCSLVTYFTNHFAGWVAISHHFYLVFEALVRTGSRMPVLQCPRMSSPRGSSWFPGRQRSWCRILARWYPPLVPRDSCKQKKDHANKLLLIGPNCTNEWSQLKVRKHLLFLLMLQTTKCYQPLMTSRNEVFNQPPNVTIHWFMVFIIQDGNHLTGDIMK